MIGGLAISRSSTMNASQLDFNNYEQNRQEDYCLDQDYLIHILGLSEVFAMLLTKSKRSLWRLEALNWSRGGRESDVLSITQHGHRGAAEAYMPESERRLIGRVSCICLLEL
jgi:hypothetical protein